MKFLLLTTIFIPSMISKAQVKHIRSLEHKKMRSEVGEFVVEGEKMVAELLHSNKRIKSIFATQSWVDEQKPESLSPHLVFVIEDFELQKISRLSTPNKVIAIVEISGQPERESGQIMLALDNIQDPGNLGSIIRIADWFGISTILCSLHTADPYNPKVVQASMGSVFRVHCLYTDLKTYFQNHIELPVYACVFDGVDVNGIGKLEKGIILIGNESKGIDAELISGSSYKISIPKKGRAESLNAAIATGIVCNALLS